MKTGHVPLTHLLLVFILFLLIYRSSQQNEPQICKQCSGTLQNDSFVGQFCFSYAGRIEGRCCLGNETRGRQRITGVDLSNCNLTHVDNLQDASAALIIDLSSNANVNVSDSAFEGFRNLSYLILPADIACPGGNSSWDRVEIREGKHFCEGQRNMCNQPGKMSADCPEYSRCDPYGPGFFECNCADNYHGYKCLREGKFPVFQVFGSLGASTFVLSLLLWFTQRRKAKSL
ncbi:all-trans retinoic acid-induced differentiation factor [Corythoichthys intestinalis]|uniref:all-trans retinoic acid-induced differentiation factor n=1 Tax=Corythoichthys intestinalis TaxID=161448 RepID=UPI0025A62111|nr:all-trans retinoic acid-induced differentiation factor [Corythoichthys intestinalis]XP_061807012.1 all-trans retinoic acid-induced differentiation factor-like [Nerophis lumbriciformis]